MKSKQCLVDWEIIRRRFEEEMVLKLRGLPGHNKVSGNLKEFRVIISHELPETSPAHLFEELIDILFREKKVNLDEIRGKYLNPQLKREREILGKFKKEFAELKKSAKNWVSQNLPEERLQTLWKEHRTWLPRRYTIYKSPPPSFQEIAADTLARYFLINNFSLHPQNIYLHKGVRVTNTWIKTEDIESFHPATQVYGIVFNNKGEILICREFGKGKWQIPGGHSEENESLSQTLKRELVEEVDVEIEGVGPLGVQKVTFPDNPEKKAIYQARCIALLRKLLPQTPDPASGITWERKFVPSGEITSYVKWGKTGRAMFGDAIRLYRSYHKKKIPPSKPKF